MKKILIIYAIFGLTLQAMAQAFDVPVYLQSNDSFTQKSEQVSGFLPSHLIVVPDNKAKSYAERDGAVSEFDPIRPNVPVENEGIVAKAKKAIEKIIPKGEAPKELKVVEQEPAPEPTVIQLNKDILNKREKGVTEALKALEMLEKDIITTKKISKKAIAKDSKAAKVNKKFLNKNIPTFREMNVEPEESLSLKFSGIGAYSDSDLNLESMKKLDSPILLTEKIDAEKKKKIAKLSGKKLKASKKFVTLSGIERSTKIEELKLAKEQAVALQKIDALSGEEKSFLKAEVFYHEGGKCHIVAPIYNAIKTKNTYRKELISLRMVDCLQQMGFFHLSHQWAEKYFAWGSNSEVRDGIKRILIEETPISYHYELGGLLNRQPSIISGLKDIKLADKANYLLSKFLLKTSKYSGALKAANKVSKESPDYSRALFVAANSRYLIGNTKLARQNLRELAAYLEKNKIKNEVKSLTSIALAQMEFRQRKYKESIKNFVKIGRNHPLWIQGLEQQAWAQLMVKDEPGAIGNMLSIQTPYFQTVYKPESYIIRALGFLSLCQFPDAYRSVSEFEKKYGDLYKYMSSFNKKAGKSSRKYYSEVTSYLKSPTSEKFKKNSMVLKEAARQKAFIKVQETINQYADEEYQATFIKGLIRDDLKKNWRTITALKTQIKATKEKIKGLKTTKKIKAKKAQLVSELNVRKLQLAKNRFYRRVMKDARTKNTSLNRSIKRQLASSIKNQQLVAGRVLRGSYKKMEKDLRLFIENNELLKYEIFSGAGSHIRYKLAGGASEGKTVNIDKEVKKAALNWEFDGEFWEDEIGHYRTEVNNLCPKNTAKR
ncbi:MAG: tetratricopeptide repeat protein [Bdellovibrionales bacterium]